MTQARDLIKKMADFFKGEEFYEKGEDVRLELSSDDVRCMNYLIQQRNKALEQEPCDDAISRQAVIDGINEYFHDEYYQRTSIQDCMDCLIEDVIKDLPLVNPQPKTGHWIEHKHNGMSYIECSECSSWFLRMHLTRNSYCPNCGIKMIEPQEGSSEG